MSDAPPAAEETRPLDEMDFLPFDSGQTKRRGYSSRRRYRRRSLADATPGCVPMLSV